MMNKWIFSLLLILSLKTSLAAAVDCPQLSDKTDRLQLQQESNQGICTVKISESSQSFPHRSFFWNSEGRVISSVESKTTAGERTIYIVPVESHLQVQGDVTQGLQYQIKASEQNWSIDKKTSALIMPNNCSGSVTLATVKNRGGINLKSCESKLIIDSGWRLGASPDLDRTGESIIHDPAGKTCKVLNRHIYKYEPGIEPSPKYVTSRDWFDFLKSQPKCQNLNINFLKNKLDPRLPANDKASVKEKHD